MLTARQKSILDYIVEFRRRQGCSPSIPEIQKAFGIRSPNGVAGHLRALEAKGYIRRSDRGSRRIDLAGPLAALRSPCFDLPLFDRLPPAGRPKGCVSLDQRTLGFHPKEGCFVLRAGEGALLGPGVRAGDMIVVEPLRSKSGGGLSDGAGVSPGQCGTARLLIRRLRHDIRLRQ